MNKTNAQEFRRIFLLEHLPEPLTRADAHLQIFDNYIAGTRLRLRTIRDPKTKKRTYVMQQRFAPSENLSTRKIAEIYLNEAEYKAFKPFEGREIRKNRYCRETDDKKIEIDVFLGNLSGLILAFVCFDNSEEMSDFAFPFDALEVTDDDFFDGANLVDKSFAEVQKRIA